jgi:PAS domain S-box-containing protein
MGMAVLRLRDSRGAGEWQLVATNAIAARVAGISIERFLNLPVIEHHAPRAPSKVPAICAEVLTSRQSRLLGHVRDETNPALAPMYIASVHPLDSDCVGMLFEDVAALNQTACQLVEAESLLEQMCESAQVIVWRADPVTLEFTRVTKEAHEILGYWVERWFKETDFWRKHAHPGDWEVVRKSCAIAAADGGKQEFDCRMIRADGRTRWFHVYVKKVTLPAGRVELAGVMVDVTDHKSVENAARKLSARVIHAQEEERRRISRDLHDSIGQYLTGLKCTIGAVIRNGECGDDTRKKLEECIETIRICMDETRSISYMLHPPILDLLGLAPALRSFTEMFAKRSDIELELDLPSGNERLDTALETALFRIAQECLTNIQRHAHSKFARLRLKYDRRHVELEIEDRGVGADPALLERLQAGKAGKGIGLLKMRERVNELKGTMTIDSNDGGTTVHVRIPRGGGLVAIRGGAKVASGSRRK